MGPINVLCAVSESSPAVAWGLLAACAMAWFLAVVDRRLR